MKFRPTNTRPALHFAPDGKSLAVVSPHDTVRLWDVATGLPLGPSVTTASAIAALVFTGDGREVVLATRCGRLHCLAVPRALAGDPQRLRTDLEAKLGLTQREGRLFLVDVDHLQELRGRQGD